MIDEEVKATKLTAIYSQLHSHNLFLRDRMFQVTSGALTLLLVIDGWLLSVAERINWSERLLVLMGIVLVFSVAVYSVRSHYREYLANAAMIVRVEEAMGTYEPGVYLGSGSLYEPASREWATGKYSSHLVRAYTVTLVLFLLLSCGVTVSL